MLFWITVLICIIIIAILYYRDMNKEHERIFSAIGVGAILGGTMGILIGFFLTGIVSCCFLDHVTPQEVGTWEICAIEDNLNIYGSWQHFEEDMYLYYIAKEYDGTRSIRKINTEQVRLIEDNNATPHITWYKKVYEEPILKFLLWEPAHQTAEIVVPSGAITTEYNIDLKG